MKVIGRAQTSNYGEADFLVQISAGELVMLVSATTYAKTNDVSRLKVGDSVTVDNHYLRLRNLLANRDTIKKQIDSLRALADLMEPLSDCVQVAIPEIKESPI